MYFISPSTRFRTITDWLSQNVKLNIYFFLWGNINQSQTTSGIECTAWFQTFAHILWKSIIWLTHFISNISALCRTLRSTAYKKSAARVLLMHYSTMFEHICTLYALKVNIINRAGASLGKGAMKCKPFSIQPSSTEASNKQFSKISAYEPTHIHPTCKRAYSPGIECVCFCNLWVYMIIRFTQFSFVFRHWG